MTRHSALFGLLLAIATPAFSRAEPAPAAPKIVSVTSMGLVVQNPEVRGRDGTFSAEINGKSYWAFDDTALNATNASGENFFDNSLSWSSTVNATNGITLNHDQTDSSDLPTTFLPYTPQEAAYQYAHNTAHCTAKPCGANLALWPNPIVYDPRANKLIVPFVEIWRIPSQSGWKTVGSGFSVGTVLSNGDFAMTRPVQNPGSKTPTLMWGPDEQAFTDESFLIGNTYYAYGDRRQFVTTHILLARVPKSQILTKSAWRYYAGFGTWSANPADAATVFDGSGADNSVFYNKYLGLWMAIYTGNFTNNVYCRVARQPEGPWSTQELLFTGADGYQGANDYAGRAHPEFSPDGGQTEYITYAHDTGFLQQDEPLTKVVFGK